ncbi:MAG TPA: DUF1801 domain-containing protein [Vicinamibacterales bacterium]|nr:DUF1801 domain-containing protein [Vicinamibacterales bacterium]
MKKTIDDRKVVEAKRKAYLASLPPAVRARMKAMRDMVRAIAPDAVEVYSYGIPGFKLDGKPLVWYAAFARHTSLYPMTASIRKAHAAALKDYKMSTGTVQFLLDKPLPTALVKRLIKARVAELR